MLNSRAIMLCAVAGTIGCTEFGDPLAIQPSTTPMLHLPIGGLSVVQSAVGTPTIDGTLGPAEWSSAAAVSFAANVPASSGGGTAPATLFVLNDATNLYFAVKIAWPLLGAISLNLEFDNNHIGGINASEGDDALVANVANSPPWSTGFFDSFRSYLPPCPPSSLCGVNDTQVGGTNDGGIAGSTDGTFTYVELWHPLDSPDNAHDFSLSSGDIVGFRLFVRLLTSSSLADTDIPAPSHSPTQYANLAIASPTIPVSIDVKPGSDAGGINRKSMGTTPVAIFSAPTFDATTIDPTTVELSGAKVAAGPNGLMRSNREDVNGDGFVDLVVHVVTADIQLTVGLAEAVLTGAKYGGQQVRGSDWVRILH